MFIWDAILAIKFSTSVATINQYSHDFNFAIEAGK